MTMPRMKLRLVMYSGLRIKNATWDIAKDSFLFRLRLITFFWFDSWKFAGIRCDFACCDLDLSLANRVAYSMRILVNSDMVSPSSLNINRVATVCTEVANGSLFRNLVCLWLLVTQ